MDDYNIPEKSNKYKWATVLLVVVVAGLLIFLAFGNNKNC
jgi:hypothetical protein